MRKSRKSLTLIEEIEKTKQYELLDHLIDPKKWEKIEGTERERLALLFLQRGESLIQKEDVSGLASLDLAAKLAPSSKDVLYQQAATHVQMCHMGGDLQSAVESLQKAVGVDPSFMEAWALLGEAYVLLGQKEDDFTYFTKVFEVFEQANKALKTLRINSPRFFWHWGRCLTAVGVFSEEPQDFKEAITKFEKAVAFGLEAGELYFDLGNALVDLASLVGQNEQINEAIKWYSRAEKLGPVSRKDFNYRLAIAFNTDFLLTNSEESFKKACYYFEKASLQHPEDGSLFLKWGDLLLINGKRKRDLPNLDYALEKLNLALRMSTNLDEILISIADCYLTIGVQQESIDALKMAYERLTNVAATSYDNYRVWYLMGMTLLEMGGYFQEANYFLEAVEKFHQGLACDRKDAKCWWGLGNAHYLLGEYRGDVASFEKSVGYYSRVVEFHEEGFPSFWNDWGVALMKLGEFNHDKSYIEAAIQRFEEALKLHMANYSEKTVEPEWIYNLGCALDYLGDLTLDPHYYEQAISVFSKVLMIHPDYPFVRYNLALALTHLGEQTSDLECFHRAQEIFEFLAEQDPEDDFVFNEWANLLIHYAELVKEPAHPERAQLIYKLAEDKLLYSIRLGNMGAIYNLACLYSIMGNIEESMTYLKKAYDAMALPPLQDLLDDDWLENLRKEDLFYDFVEMLKQEEGEI